MRRAGRAPPPNRLAPGCPALRAACGSRWGPSRVPQTRHWRHICTKEKGLAVVPPILQAEGSGENTVSNCMKLASKKYGGEKCMGSREITQCAITTKGAKKFQAWTKGDYVWQTYSAVFHQIEKTAKGLLALPGIAEKRKAGGAPHARPPRRGAAAPRSRPGRGAPHPRAHWPARCAVD